MYYLYIIKDSYYIYYIDFDIIIIMILYCLDT